MCGTVGVLEHGCSIKYYEEKFKLIFKTLFNVRIKTKFSKDQLISSSQKH